MSLINDALKRARQAQQKNPPSGGPPLMPVEPEKPGRASEWMLPVVIIFLIVAACFFIGLALARHTVTKIVVMPEPAVTQQVEAVAIPVVQATTNTEPEIPAPAPPKVQGIVYDPVRPWAIVDGRTVFIGDRVREFRVKEIAKNTITLEATNGAQEKLGLGQ